MAFILHLIKIGAFVALLHYLIRLARGRYKLMKTISWAPGPIGLPLLGNIRELFGLDQAGMLDLFTELHNKFGNVMRISVGTDTVISVADPELLHVISSRGKHSFKSVEYTFLEIFLGRSLLTSSGEVWHQKRKLLNPCFHYDVLETFMASINTHSKNFVQHLRKYATNSETFNFLSKAKLFTLDILMDTIMGINLNALQNESNSYVQAVSKMREIVIKRSLSVFLRFDVFYSFSSVKKEEDKAVQVIKAFVKEVITSRKQKRESLASNGSQTKGLKKKALLDMFLDLMDKGNILDDKEIENEVNTFIFAGHDTSSVALSFALFLIGKHPDIQEKLFEELVEKLPNFEETGLSQIDLSKLEYMDRCVKESLRLYSPVPLIGKILQQPLETERGCLPDGINITENLHRMHNDKNNYPRPDVYNPDRFLPDEVLRRGAHTFTPFGSGVRICIGQKFALNEIKVSLCYLIKNFRIESVDEPKDLKISYDIVLTPLNGIHLRLHER